MRWVLLSRVHLKTFDDELMDVMAKAGHILADPAQMGDTRYRVMKREEAQLIPISQDDLYLMHCAPRLDDNNMPCMQSLQNCCYVFYGSGVRLVGINTEKKRHQVCSIQKPWVITLDWQLAQARPERLCIS